MARYGPLVCFCFLDLTALVFVSVAIPLCRTRGAAVGCMSVPRPFASTDSTCQHACMQWWMSRSSPGGGRCLSWFSARRSGASQRSSQALPFCIGLLHSLAIVMVLGFSVPGGITRSPFLPCPSLPYTLERYGSRLVHSKRPLRLVVGVVSLIIIISSKCIGLC
ncbi:unnamed protein product [Ectocarpus sp. 4 AP-2014]